MRSIKLKDQYYQFRPSWVGCIITLICIPLFIKLGVWQYSKAQVKLDIQSAYQLSIAGMATPFPIGLLEIDAKKNQEWQYKRVEVQGEYQTKYQFLLDNQVNGNRAGYHVITPFKIKHSDEYVLVNRGWIPANDTHTDYPEVKTPTEQLIIIGQVWLPSKKFFSLEKINKNTVNNFERVWQNMDLIHYKKTVPMPVSALMIKLDAASQAGGFVRNWDVPQARIITHMGYAYQWFGFAFATLCIFIFMSFKATKKSSVTTAL